MLILRSREVWPHLSPIHSRHWQRERSPSPLSHSPLQPSSVALRNPIHMRHPFANVQYYSNQLGCDDDTDDSEDVPSSIEKEKEKHRRALAIPARKPQPHLAHPLSQAQDAATQVVKRSRRLAVLLGGQEPGSALPTYRPGSVINGCLAILSPTELLAVRVVVRETAPSRRHFADVPACRYTATSTSTNSLAPDEALRRYSTRTSTRGPQIAILPFLSGSPSGTPFLYTTPIPSLEANARSHPPTMRTCPASRASPSMCRTT